MPVNYSSHNPARIKLIEFVVMIRKNDISFSFDEVQVSYPLLPIPNWSDGPFVPEIRIIVKEVAGNTNATL
jgi:hypothetical protein